MLLAYLFSSIAFIGVLGIWRAIPMGDFGRHNRNTVPEKDVCGEMNLEGAVR